MASIQNIMGVVRNVDSGLELVEFSPELQKHSFEVAAMQHVIPAWINRLKGDTGPIELFNQKIGPKVGVRIESDGSVVKIN